MTGTPAPGAVAAPVPHHRREGDTAVPPVPPAALAIIRAALHDHHLVTPPTASTPIDAANHVVAYLMASGYIAHRAGHIDHDAAADAIAIVLTLHSILTAPETSTPDSAAAYIAAELPASGWHITPSTHLPRNAT